MITLKNLNFDSHLGNPTRLSLLLITALRCDASSTAKQCLPTMRARQSATDKNTNTSEPQFQHKIRHPNSLSSVPNISSAQQHGSRTHTQVFVSCLKFDDLRKNVSCQASAKFRVLPVSTARRLSKTHRAPCCRNNEIGA